MKNDFMSSIEQQALDIIKIYGYEKFVSNLGEKGGYITKPKQNKLSKKIHYIPLYISREYAEQVINRKKLYDFYILLKSYVNKSSNLQQQLATEYAHIFKKVQNVCSQLKDDRQVTEFIDYLSKKCETDIVCEMTFGAPSLFARFPINYKLMIKSIISPSEDDLNYINRQLKHINELLMQNKEDSLNY